MFAVEVKKLGAKLTEDSELGQLDNHVIFLASISPDSSRSVVIPYL